jgi:hypothetical protein
LERFRCPGAHQSLGLAVVIGGHRMIFVLDEDNVLYVADAEAELQGAFEGVDVEDGVFSFFDESGSPLVAEFTVPNKRGKIWGQLGWVRSGTYRLLRCHDATVPHLSAVLSTVHGIEPNRYFADVEAVRRALIR